MVLTDPDKELGIVSSQKADNVMMFLESCAGAPEGALALLFPYHRKALRILRGSGYARRCWKPGREPFWSPAGKPVPDDYTYDARCALGWLAARLIQSGARLEGRIAVFKNGTKLKVHVVPPVPLSEEPGLAVITVENKLMLPGGWYFVKFKDLIEKELKKCLQKS